jgi:nicotianamine synthase
MTLSVWQSKAPFPEAEPPSDVGDRLHRVYHQLALLPSLDPSAHVDALFGELVGLVQNSPAALAAHLMADPVLFAVQERLQALCAEGEARLEAHWARRIIESPEGGAWMALEAFPYFSNYERLARLEVAALRMTTDDRQGADRVRPARRALFVGSGPLPLTSILLAARHGLTVTNLDVDPTACLLGRRLALRLGIEASCDFIHRDVLAHASLADVDVVFMAALVGRHRTEKRAILAHIARHLPSHASVVVRSAHRLRTLLYPGVDVADLGGLGPLLELHPHDEVINSVIVARLPAGPSRTSP